jgi:hypothetical protein
LQFTIVDNFIASLKVQDYVLSVTKAMILVPGNYWAYQSNFNFSMLYQYMSYEFGEYVKLQLDRRFWHKSTSVAEVLEKVRPKERFLALRISADLDKRLVIENN